MNLKGILAISGTPGLYRVIAQTKSGFIVESLIDQKRKPVSASQQISMLEDISVYTTGDDMPLKEVFQKFLDYSKSNQLPDIKGNTDLKAFLKNVIPDYDQERVYSSDIKKMISWFGLVKDLPAEEESSDTSQEKVTETESGDESSVS
jgi:hypothetical protein